MKGICNKGQRASVKANCETSRQHGPCGFSPKWTGMRVNKLPAISTMKKDIEIPITALRRWMREIFNVIISR